MNNKTNFILYTVIIKERVRVGETGGKINKLIQTILYENIETCMHASHIMHTTPGICIPKPGRNSCSTQTDREIDR